MVRAPFVVWSIGPCARALTATLFVFAALAALAACSADGGSRVAGNSGGSRDVGADGRSTANGDIPPSKPMSLMGAPIYTRVERLTKPAGPTAPRQSPRAVRVAVERLDPAARPPVRAAQAVSALAEAARAALAA